MILKSEKIKKKTKPKQNKIRQKTILNNRLKNKTVFTIVSQFTVCHFCFYFLSGILLLRQENEHYSKYL